MDKAAEWARGGFNKAVRWAKDLYPFAQPEGEEFLELAARTASEAIGEPRRPETTVAWIDAAHFANQTDASVVAFGCGAPNQSHTADEHVIVDDLVRHSKAVALVLHRYLGGRQ